MPYRITAPNSEYSGKVGNVMFYRGQSITPVEEVDLDYFQRHNYMISDWDAPVPENPTDPGTEKHAVEAEETPANTTDNETPDTGAEPPNKGATVGEWSAFLTSQNIEVKPGARRSEMIAAWEAHKAGK
ncbi:MAG: hypothetical protein Q4A82_01060 [Corynebacterium sp.]|nr:hypothetical protein [Corynebacterium sp.]